MTSSIENEKLKGLLANSDGEWGNTKIQRMEITGLNMVIYEDVYFLVPANYFQVDSLHSIYIEVWLAGMYDVFPVEGEQIVDVGGFLGDTALYFIRKGATFVNIYEPGDTGGYIGVNMVLNGVSNEQYKHHSVAVTGEVGEIHTISTWNCGATAFSNNNPVPERKGEEVVIPTVTLADIAVQDAILKFDSEGSEYNTFEHADCSTIRMFKAIMMEYHNRGADLITNKLIDCGFEIIKTSPNGGNSMSGMIYAKRI